MTRQKLKPGYDSDEIKCDLIEMVCFEYNKGNSIRAVAKQFEISPMKVRKIIITGGVYSTELSSSIEDLYKSGKTPAEIADLLHMTVANVNSYLPYEKIIYNMEERSVGADRQVRYRERKCMSNPAVTDMDDTERRKVAIQAAKNARRFRTETMIFVLGPKLKHRLPKEVLEDGRSNRRGGSVTIGTIDPLTREQITWGSNATGEFVMHEAPDPDKNIWCAELTTSGRENSKKEAVILMSANSGFMTISPLPDMPEDDNLDRAAYREKLGEAFLQSIKEGLLDFSVSEDITDTYVQCMNIQLIKGGNSVAMNRLIEQVEQLHWKSGDDPIDHFNVRGNFAERKYGNSPFYRRVEEGVFRMLGMDETERKEWMERFTEPYRSEGVIR